LLVGAALPAARSSDDDNEGVAQADDGGAHPMPPNVGGTQLSLASQNPIDAYVVQGVPTEESRLARLSRLAQDAPLAEIVNVMDIENANKSSTNRSLSSHYSEDQRRTMLMRGGIILLLVLTATLVSLNAMGRLSKSTSTPSLLETNVPTGVLSMAPTTRVPSMALTSGAPSMAPTTPEPTSDRFSIMASRIFTNPEEERPRDPSSPQWKALMWLAYEDDYNTTIIDQLVRRYALATLYYVTNGTG
jgi:hypothetical protein